jgi:hypothetical protein
LAFAIAMIIIGPAIGAARTKSDAQPGVNRAAAVERQKDCGRQWQNAKANDAIKSAGWPKYWSACNKRVKAAS